MKISPRSTSKSSPIRVILKNIQRSYGRVPSLKLSKPVDELIRTVLSQNTSDRNSLAAFAVLKNNFRSWEDLIVCGTSKIARLIRHAGLANIKARRIKDLLIEIKHREGALSLASLKNMDTDEAYRYLRSLKGVGPKTASCVLLFSFGKPLMLVDTHIYRVAKRLGIIPQDLSIEGAHELLSSIIPEDLIYELHLGIIEHGRKTCKAQNPRCGVCLLYGLCKFKQKFLYKKRGID